MKFLVLYRSSVSAQEMMAGSAVEAPEHAAVPHLVHPAPVDDRRPGPRRAAPGPAV